MLTLPEGATLVVTANEKCPYPDELWINIEAIYPYTSYKDYLTTKDVHLVVSMSEDESQKELDNMTRGQYDGVYFPKQKKVYLCYPDDCLRFLAETYRLETPNQLDM